MYGQETDLAVAGTCTRISRENIVCGVTEWRKSVPTVSYGIAAPQGSSFPLFLEEAERLLLERG